MLGTGLRRCDGGRRVPHARGTHQDRLDLTEFDPLAAQFDLEVLAAQVFEHSTGPPDGVAGAVQPRTGGAERIGDETCGGGHGLRAVTTRHLIAAEIQFTRDTVGHQPEPVVENVGPDTGDGFADGDPAGCRVVVVDRRVDGGLGGPVLIVQPGRRPRGRHGGGHSGRYRLATGRHLRQCRRPLGVTAEGLDHRRQHHRDDHRRGHPVRRDDVGDRLRVTVGARCEHDQWRAEQRRARELQHSRVEGVLEQLHEHVVGGKTVVVTIGVDLREQCPLGDGHALGATRRTRGEQGVCGVLGCEPAEPLGVRDLPDVRTGSGRLRAVDDEGLDPRNPLSVDVVGEHQRHRRGITDVRGAIFRRVGCNRDELAAGNEHRMDGHRHLHSPPEAQTDRGIRSDPGRDKLPGSCIHVCGELTVSHRPVAEHYGRPSGRSGGQRRCKRRGDGARRGVRRGTGRVGKHLFALSVAEQIDVADRPPGIVGDGIEQPDQPTEHRGHRGLVEQVGGVGGHRRPWLTRRARGDDDGHVLMCGYQRCCDGGNPQVIDGHIGAVDGRTGVERQRDLR